MTVMTALEKMGKERDERKEIAIAVAILVERHLGAQ